MGVEAIQHDCKGEATPVFLSHKLRRLQLSGKLPAPGDPIMEPGIGAEQRDLENRPLGKTRTRRS